MKLTHKQLFDILWQRISIIENTNDACGGIDWLEDELFKFKLELDKVEKGTRNDQVSFNQSIS